MYTPYPSISDLNKDVKKSGVMTLRSFVYLRIPRPPQVVQIRNLSRQDVPRENLRSVPELRHRVQIPFLRLILSILCSLRCLFTFRWPV